MSFFEAAADFLKRGIKGALVGYHQGEMSQDELRWRFQFACETDDIDAARVLLADPKTNPDAFIQGPNYALLILLSARPKILKLLLDDGRADPTIDNSWLLSQSALGNQGDGYPEALKLLLDDGRADPRESNNQAIRLASERGKVDIVKLLLADPRVDPTADDNYAIKWARQNGHDDVVRLLLSDQRILHQRLVVACQSGDIDTVRDLLADPRVDPTAWMAGPGYVINSTILYPQILKLFLDDGRADPRRSPTMNNWMIITSSIGTGQADRLGFPEALKLLLDDGRADPEAQDNLSIRIASEYGVSDVIRLLLLDGRADPTADNNYAIRKACQNGHADVVRLLLLDGRADPTAVGGEAIGHPDIVRLLKIDGRANLDAKDMGRKKKRKTSIKK